jgi:hypothetical protein
MKEINKGERSPRLKEGFSLEMTLNRQTAQQSLENRNNGNISFKAGALDLQSLQLEMLHAIE